MNENDSGRLAYEAWASAHVLDDDDDWLAWDDLDAEQQEIWDDIAATVSIEGMLRESHAALNVHGGLMPPAPTVDIPAWVTELRIKLLDEEAAELRDAMTARDLLKIADGIVDVVYVAVGTAVAYGIPFDAVLRAVHVSNMTKTSDPGLGKLLKGPGYEPPRIAELLGIDEDPK